MADGGAAFVTKLHHSLTDGIGGIQLAALVVDPSREPRPVELPRVPEGHAASRVKLTALTLADDAAEAATAAGHVVRSVPRDSIRAARHPVSVLRSTVRTARSIGRFVAPIARPLSPVLGERRTSRVLATLDVPFTELHAAARASGGHLNDAFLAAVTDAMHRYHERRGAPLDEVRVTVPVSIRGADDGVGGNRITLTRIKLPADIAEPAERIRHIGRIVNQWRQEPALAHTQQIAFGLNRMPRSLPGGIFKRVEMLASDVPGPPQPVFLAGARINGYYAFGPTIGAGVNATLMSYAGICNIGLNVDTGAIDDPDLFLTCLTEAFHDVLALAPRAPEPV